MGDTDAPQVATHVLSQQFAASTHVPSVHQRCWESSHSQRTGKQPSWYHPKELVVILHAGMEEEIKVKESKDYAQFLHL